MVKDVYIVFASGAVVEEMILVFKTGDTSRTWVREV